MRRNTAHRRQMGGSLAELVIAAAIGATALTVMFGAMVAIHKSISASYQFSFRLNNGNRLADAVAQDLRRAVKLGTIVPSSGVYTKLDSSSSAISVSGVVTDANTIAIVSDTTTLAITIPDYYGSNTPDNSHGSSYKSTRYPRSTLNTSSTYNGNTGSATALNGVVPWATAVSSTRAIQFSSTGTGLIQVRYTRARRSTSDPTICFFRTEYPSDSNTANSAGVEIAEEVVDSDSVTSLIVIDPDRGLSTEKNTHYRIQSNFTPRYRFLTNNYSYSDDQFVDVYLRNARRD